MRQLIINGDDFGYTAGVVEAILQAHAAGIITSTSAMVNMPAWEAGAARLRATPSLGAGVHLVFNEGRPVLPPEQVPTLVDEQGYFLNDAALQEHGDRLDVAQLKAEFRAQIARFRAAGLEPTHLDNHCSISYRNAEWFAVAVELAAAYRLPMRLPFGDDLVERAPAMARDAGGFPVELVIGMGRYYQQLLAEHGVRRPNRFLMEFSKDGQRTPEHLLSIIAHLPDGLSELLTHPGYGIAWRQEEIEALLDPRVLAALRASDIALVNYRVLK